MTGFETRPGHSALGWLSARGAAGSGFQGCFLFLQKAPLLAGFAYQFTPQKMRFSGVKVKGKTVGLRPTPCELLKKLEQNFYAGQLSAIKLTRAKCFVDFVSRSLAFLKGCGVFRGRREIASGDFPSPTEAAAETQRP
ncbi:hypothetical protein D7X94_05835 [Acutalibacter sp. 1XD8-33]|nr:hypothetical protein D7X94_05835 [Acutalibacter sp. 1XD8-33]